MKSAQNGGFGRKERRPECDRCDFWQGATHEGQMWLWPTLSRIWLASCFSNTGFFDFSSLLELHSCCAAFWGDCLVSDSLWQAPFQLLCLASPFSPFLEESLSTRCASARRHRLLLWSPSRRSREVPRGKTPLGLFHSFFDESRMSCTAFLGAVSRLSERNELFSPAWYPVQSSYFFFFLFDP